MKLLLTIIFFSCALFSEAQNLKNKKQKGYGQMAFSLYGSDEVFASPGLSFGAGALLGNNITTGVGFDIYMFNKFNKEGLRFSQAYADFRAYYAGLEKAGPYIAFQPGVVLLKKEAISKVKAGFSMNLMGGFFVRISKQTGVTGSLGYGLLTYQEEGIEKRRHGVKFNVGFCF
ncbi:MAG TPA: hypothetical protein VF476_06755 [Chitinophagaceae bacterium]